MFPEEAGLAKNFERSWNQLCQIQLAHFLGQLRLDEITGVATFAEKQLPGRPITLIRVFEGAAARMNARALARDR